MHDLTNHACEVLTTMHLTHAGNAIALGPKNKRKLTLPGRHDQLERENE